MRRAYGGVVFDDRGRVLLREPAGRFDGYAWTFAKGRPEAGEEAERTALREVLEETGARARVVARIPGSFRGGTTENVLFLMELVEQSDELDRETRSVRWATPGEARELIAETTNEVGRARDLAVLEAALALRATLAGHRTPPSGKGRPRRP